MTLFKSRKYDINDQIEHKYTVILDEKIKNFFKKEPYNLLLPETTKFNDERMLVSYENVLGIESYLWDGNKHLRNSDKQENKDQTEYYPLDQAIYEHLFEIKDKKELAKSDALVRKLAEKLKSSDKGIKRIARSFMTNSRTIPIKISYRSKYTHEPENLFVKKPHLKRIIGAFFYNIISGLDPLNYRFNEHIFVEEGLRGMNLAMDYEENKFEDEKYFRGLGRFALHGEFLKLEDDLVHQNNRIVTDNNQTMLFDFDRCFVFFKPNTLIDIPNKPYGDLLMAYRQAYGDNEILKHMNINFRKLMREGYQEEKKQVAKRLIMNDTLVSKVAKLFGKQEYTLTKQGIINFDTYVKQHTGLNFEQYIEDRINHYFNT